MSDNDLRIRFMIRRDMPSVEHIEQVIFPNPWSHDDFIRCLRQRNCIGMIAEYGDDLVGYMIYELHKNRIHILNFAVDPKYRRDGIGTAMLAKLKGKLSCDRRIALSLEVRETNIDAQLFFRSQGFFAISVLRNFYDDSAEDAYLMRYVHPSSVLS
jgi:ribosomal-protein-alanine N-acetyltransferase